MHFLWKQAKGVWFEKNLEKRRPFEDLRAAFWYLKGAYKKIGQGFSQGHVVTRTSGSDLKLKEF